MFDFLNFFGKKSTNENLQNNFEKKIKDKYGNVSLTYLTIDAVILEIEHQYNESSGNNRIMLGRLLEMYYDAKEKFEMSYREDPYFKFEIVGDTGSPTQYYNAVKSFNLFKNFYSEFYFDALELNVKYNYDIKCIEILSDVAPKIGDVKIIKFLVETIRGMCLKDKYHTLAFRLENNMRVYQDFYTNKISNDYIKQVDLVKILQEIMENEETYNPPYDTPSNYFFVLRQFDLVRCEKRGKYNYLAKNSRDFEAKN